MSRTRAELDQKLTLLQSKVQDLTPRRLSERYLPDYFADRVTGGILTLIGLKMAWGQYRELKQRRERRQRQVAGYGHWQ
jgi:hypothetical protein